jgi:hypothetical protein
MGEYVEAHRQDRAELQRLTASLRTLASFLEKQYIAHGDVQTGNVMVADRGRSVQLIDYDGMYVDGLQNLGSAELGHRNFQHPKRTEECWDTTLDRFSFLVLNLAMRVLEAHPDLWDKTQSDGDTVLFRANDFLDPSRSIIFNDLFRRQEFAQDAKNLAAICQSPFNSVPTLEDFLAGRNIPRMVITIPTTTVEEPAAYIGAFPVLDARDYAMCLGHVGDRVEVIGCIAEVKEGTTKHGKPYLFINFGPWRGRIVKISIWSEGLALLARSPDRSWVGRWISVVGLMEPPYRNKKYGYSHLSISITQASQLCVIPESDARFRLSGQKKAQSARGDGLKNKSILTSIQDGDSVGRTTPRSAYTTTTHNQAVLTAMQVGGVASADRRAQKTKKKGLLSRIYDQIKKHLSV